MGEHLDKLKEQIVKSPLYMLAELRDDNQRFIASMREAHDVCDEHNDVAAQSVNFHRARRKACVVSLQSQPERGADGTIEAFDRELTGRRAVAHP